MSTNMSTSCPNVTVGLGNSMC